MTLLLAVCLVWLLGLPGLFLLWNWVDRWREQVAVDRLLRSVGFDATRLGPR